jgi:hypothetical protein
VAIQTAPDAESAFGGAAPVMPANAAIDESIPAQQTAPAPGQQTAPPPAQTVRAPVATGAHTVEALRTAGWTDDAMVQAGHARWEETPVSDGVTPAPDFV